MKKLVHMLALAVASLSVGCGTLASATREGDLASVKERLAKGENPNGTDDRGNTALCIAIETKHEDLREALLAAKADPNVNCYDGRSPLTHAVGSRDYQALKSLLAHGANPYPGERKNLLLEFSNDRDLAPVFDAYLDHVDRVDGRAKVLSLINGRETPTSMSVLVQTAYNGDDANMHVFVNHGADPNTMIDVGQGEQYPLMFYARRTGNQDLVDVLVRAGAKADARSKNGLTYEESAGPAWAAVAQEQAAEDAHWAAIKRQNEADERREDREAAQRQAAQTQAMWNRLNGTTPSNNPVDDNSFRDRMMAQAQGRSPSAPASSNGTASAPSTAPTSTGGSTNPSSNAAAPSPPGSATGTPMPPKRDCRYEDRSGPNKSLPLDSRDKAEQNLENVARHQCTGTRGGYSLEGKTCREKREAQTGMVDGRLKRIEDKIFYVCEAHIRCEKQMEICGSSGPSAGGVTKQ